MVLKDACLVAALVWFVFLTFTSERPAPAYELTVADQQIAGPEAASDFPAWLSAMKAWRARELRRIGEDTSAYARAPLAWTARSFVQAHAMVEDRLLYDPIARRYTVKAYLDDLEQRYGGVDSVLVWPTYPNIGIDDRNTDDMMRSMPGGIPAIRRMVADFHDAGVRVLFPIHPWDTGTRDPGAPWWTVLPDSMAQIDGDGLNGDTMNAVPREYFNRSMKAGRPLALEPELGLAGALDQIGWNTMSYGYWSFPKVPMVSRNKWLEPRHIVHVNDRWATDKTDLLQYAFFNGVGFGAWENVWGIWNQLSPRDAAALRRIAAIERMFADLLVSGEWEPHTPTIQGKAAFASRFPDANGKATLWTIVNRSDGDLTGEQLRVPYAAPMQYYDLWHGARLIPRVDGDAAVLSFGVEPRGYGAVWAGDVASLPKGFDAFLSRMRAYAEASIPGPSPESAFLPQHITAIDRTVPLPLAPPEMIRIPAADFDFRVEGVEIEGGDRVGVDVQYPWESAPGRRHRHTVSIRAFYIDRYNVTNAQFRRFLTESGYRPEDDHNFLREWVGGDYPAGWGDKPVTWVSLEDARAYASWAGKRLPHEWEWQYAAQGPSGRLYPWGNTWDSALCPTPTSGRTLTAPADVTAFPGGKSPFGLMDLVGNVWQWTDEYTDRHTRAAVLRGGSHYQPQGSHWYFPKAHRLDQHGKYLLMAQSRDRSGAIGFRCVADTPEGGH
jgi:formylglycine-generating enzyme required for sulfatase activity